MSQPPMNRAQRRAAAKVAKKRQTEMSARMRQMREAAAARQAAADVAAAKLTREYLRGAQPTVVYVDEHATFDPEEASA